MAGVGKKIKKNITWMQWIVPTVLFALFMTFSLVNYYDNARVQAKQDVIKEFSEQMSFYSGQYDVAYFYCRSMAQSAADFCEAHSEDMFSDQNVELMQNICKNYSYKFQFWKIKALCDHLCSQHYVVIAFTECFKFFL